MRIGQCKKGGEEKSGNHGAKKGQEKESEA
jgi:hypothetical protein